MKTVQQVMTTGIPTVRVGQTAAEATSLILECNIRVLPVVEGETLVGLVTMRDLLRALPSWPISQVMVRDVVTATLRMPIPTAYALMEERQVRQLPVVDGERLAGLITREDVLRELGHAADPLTGLSWGTAMRERAIEFLKRGQEIVIIFLDMDGFGTINKRFGHVVGDRCIQAVANTLLATIDPAKDMLCRYGGDEFAILTTRRRDDAERLRRAAVDAIATVRPVDLPGGVVLAASTGIAGGRRTTERRSTHFAATVNDLITAASRQSSHAKIAKNGQAGADGISVLIPAEPRLTLERLNLSVENGEEAAAVQLSLGHHRFRGETRGPSVGAIPLRLPADSTVQAVNQALPEGWNAAVDEVSIIRTSSDTLVVMVTVALTKPDEPIEILAGCVPVRGDLGTATVKATLQALNRRLGTLITRGAAPLHVPAANGASRHLVDAR